MTDPAPFELDPSCLKFRAVLDWAGLCITLPAPSQARHLRNRMPAHWGAPFAQPVPTERPESCRVFIVRVQDPNPAALETELAQIDPGATAVITAIELALDVSAPDINNLPEVAHAMHRNHAHPPAGTPRITRPDRYQAAANRREILQALTDGMTINTGEKDADHCSRVYVKTCDTTNGEAYAPLPQEQHRARLEVTLSGNACPVRTLHDLQSFKFEQLTDLFAMVKPRDLSTPLAQLLQQQRAQLGKPREPDRTTKRSKSRTTERDTPVNGRIRDALRCLTKRTATAVKNAKIREELSP